MTPEALFIVLLASAFSAVAAIIVTNKVLKFSHQRETVVIDISQDTETLLDFLATATIVVDEKNRVVRNSPNSMTLGLIKNNSLNSEELRSLITQTRNSSGPVEIEFSGPLLDDGDQIWLAARGVKLDAGLCLLLVEDRTEAHRLDEMRRDFVANVSHELKTPIGAISLLSEAISGAADDPQTIKKFSKNLKREALRLTDLVRDIMQLSRIQSRDLMKTAKQVRVASVIQLAVEANQIAAEAGKIKVTVNCPKDIFVAGDSELLTVAVKNLVENSIRYSNPGSNVGIGVQTSGRSVDISIADTGIGIAPADQARIFERFYRVDESRSRETGGTGLGLSIVKHIALAHHGEIRLFSKKGVGSTFTLSLPKLDQSKRKDTTK